METTLSSTVSSSRRHNRLVQLLFEPSDFFRGTLHCVNRRRVIVLYAVVGLALMAQFIVRYVLLDKTHHIPTADTIAALPFFCVASLTMLALPAWYWLMWRMIKGGALSDVPTVGYQYRAALYIILSALVVEAIGAVLSIPLMLWTGNPNFAWSLQSLFSSSSHLLAWIASRLDLLIIWEVIILAAGFRVLYRWHHSRLHRRSYWWAIVITQLGSVIVFLLGQFIAS